MIQHLDKSTSLVTIILPLFGLSASTKSTRICALFLFFPILPDSIPLLTYALAFPLVKKVFRSLKATDKLVLAKATGELLTTLGQENFALPLEPTMIIFGSMSEIDFVLQQDQADQHAKELLRGDDVDEEQTERRKLLRSQLKQSRKDKHPTKSNEKEQKILQELETLELDDSEDKKMEPLTSQATAPTLSIPSSPIATDASSSTDVSSLSSAGAAATDRRLSLQSSMRALADIETEYAKVLHDLPPEHLTIFQTVSPLFTQLVGLCKQQLERRQGRECQSAT